MTGKEYQALAIRTCSIPYDCKADRLYHAVFGLNSEAGEVAGILQKKYQGHEVNLEMDVCPVCGSTNLTKIDRMNGYLSYSRVHGDTRLNAAKMAEIAERRSM